MSDKVSMVRVLTAATGNGTSITLGARYSDLFMTPADAGAIDGRTYTWLIVDGNNFELVKGAYHSSGTTMDRTKVLFSRISGTLGTTRLSLSGSAQVRIVESAADMDGIRGTRAVSGTSDVIASTDLGLAITYTNASAIAASLAQAGTANLDDGWATWVQNLGAGTLTITPATSTINGAATLVLATNLGAFIWSDGTNYHAFIVPVGKPLLAANNLSDIASASTARTNLAVLAIANNLSDVASVSTSRSNLGLGTAAVRADTDFVRFDAAQSATAAQQNQARSNAGVPGLNILVNPDFRINQMGYVSAATLSSGSYGHDQWKAGSGGGDYSFTQLGSSTQITIASSKTLIQVIEDKNVAGGSYVLSWTGSAQARYAINSATPAGSYASSPIVISSQTAGTTMSVEFNAGTLGTVKLESATIATQFIMREYDEEFVRCLRYFETLGGDDANQCFCMATATSTTQSLGYFQFFPKRAVPVITISAAGDFINTTSGNGSLTCSALSFDQVSKTTARQFATVSTGLVAGNATRLVSNNTTNARIKIDARI